MLAHYFGVSALFAYQIQTHLSPNSIMSAISQPRSVATIDRQSAMTDVGGGGYRDREWSAKRRIKRGTFTRCDLWYLNCASFKRLRATMLCSWGEGL